MHNFYSRVLKKYWLTCSKPVAIFVLLAIGLTACGETKDTETLITEAIEYQKKGNDNAAIIQLKNAVQQEPNNGRARFLLGTLYKDSNDLLSAEKELDRALDLGVDGNKVLPVLGQVLFDLGKFQYLIDLSEKYADNSPVEIQILRGRALLAVGRNEESKALLDKILEENPNSPEVLIGLAQHAWSENDLDSANQLANKAVEMNPENVMALLFKANLLQAQNKPEQALDTFEQVIRLAPDNIGAHNGKITLEIALRKFDDARNSIMRAREIAPNSLSLSYSQAALDFNDGKHAEALATIQTVLRSAPDHLPSILLAGTIQLALGSLIQAEQNLEQYLEKIPGNIHARKLLIGTLLGRNKTQQAIRVLEPVLPYAQNDVRLLTLAGETYMRSGDFAKASEYFERANELLPDNAALHTALGMSMLARGDREHGIAELELAVDLDKNSSRASILLVLAHFRSNEFNKALPIIKELEAKDLQNPLFRNLKGLAYMGLNDFAQARVSLNQALSLQPDFFPAISNLARLDIQEQKPDVARKRFEAILNKDDKHIQAMHALAELALVQGNVDDATKWFEQASNKNPNALEPALILSAHYLRFNDKEKALLLARKLNGTHPNEPRVLELLGQVQLAHNNHAAALDSFERLAARMPESALVQLKIAEIHAEMKDYEGASSALRRALHINPNFVEAKVAQARLAIIEQKEHEAMSIAHRIQQEHADQSVGYEVEGDVLMRQQKPEMAVKVYEKAFSIKQTSPLAIKMHSALSQAGNDAKANAHITQWLSNNPNDSATRLYLANNYLSKKHYEKATKEYEAIVQENPRHIMSLNNLAWLYQNNKDPRALEYAEKAYKIAPELPAIMDTLGWILVEKGEIERALPLLGSAASKESNNATIQYHYAYALIKSGNPTQAKQILSVITAPDSDFPEINAARELLKQVQ
ncbi:MAG: PEP-CTERM system TPR-repeat protein PrsT [Nitrosomonas sp.]|nr:PEP-CTERM system TPR-repeat protein PrsT [Nitrosomonas sp.]